MKFFLKILIFVLLSQLVFMEDLDSLKTVNGKKDSWKMNLFPFALSEEIFLM